MARPKKVIHQLTLRQFEQLFPDEDACKVYLRDHRWPDEISCPRCGSKKIYELSTMPFKWECIECAEGHAYRFSVLVGTIFENTNYPLRIWFQVIHMMLTSKKGVSALQVHRVIGTGSYRTAWSMCHRIRVGLQDKHFRRLLGIVEVDEMFVGGKVKNRHKDKRGPGSGGGRGSTSYGKVPVAGAIKRGGKVVAKVIDGIDTETLTRFVRATVSDKVSLLVTDQWPAYRKLGSEYPHATINHALGQYVVGAIHTNTIEGFWSIFKRGVVGTYHKVSKKYLPLYIAEFQFRYNNRKNPDIFGSAIKGC
jgi:transposase-like protein